MREISTYLINNQVLIQSAAGCERKCKFDTSFFSKVQKYVKILTESKVY